MSRTFIRYLIGWFAAIGLFNLITFITPVDFNGRDENPTLFFIAYGFITVLFLAKLVCSYIALDLKADQNRTLTFPLISVSAIALTVMLIVGSICMVLPFIADWLGIILCALVLVVYIIVIMGTSAATATIVGMEGQINVQTYFIKAITADALVLSNNAPAGIAKTTAVKIYEAFRYSDPMSIAALAEIETRISEKFAEFSVAVSTNNEESIAASAAELQMLIDQRNARCKIMK